MLCMMRPMHPCPIPNRTFPSRSGLSRTVEADTETHAADLLFGTECTCHLRVNLETQSRLGFFAQRPEYAVHCIFRDM
jgi:hypothetical protein